MSARILRALGLGTLIALLTAAGGYGFLQMAHAQSLPPGETAGATMEVESAGSWLGLMVVNLNDQTAARLGIPQQPGVAVVRVVPDGPAAKAGVQEKDVIAAVNGVTIDSLQSLRQQMQTVNPGDTVQLTVSRAGQTLQVAVTAAATPAKPHSGQRPGAGVLPFLPGLLGPAAAQGFENSFGGTFTYKDPTTGQPVTISAVFGTVVSVSGNDVVVKPNSGQANATFRITADTRMRGAAADLKADDKVVAVTKQGSTDLVALMRFMQTQKDTQRGARQHSKARIAQAFPGPARAMEQFPALRDHLSDRLEATRERVESNWVY